MNVSKQIKKEISAILGEITNHLIINGSMVPFSGLLYGKFGISLFFFHYGRYTGNSLYLEYARYLVDLVKSQIHDDYPLDYEHGLAGVGIGLDYLGKYEYYDVDDDLIHQIDTKIIKALSYESRVSLLIGFGKYLLSRYDSNPTFKNSIIQLVDLIIHSSEPIQNILVDTISFLYDLYLLDIEKEKIEAYLSDLIGVFISSVHKKPIYPQLFILIKLSQNPLNNNYCQIVHDLLQNIIIQKNMNFANIYDLQWLLCCEQFLKYVEYQGFMLKLNRKIAKNISSFHLFKLDDLFSENKNFAFEGGYAGLGLALISILAPDNNSWTKLFKL